MYEKAKSILRILAWKELSIKIENPYICDCMVNENMS